MQNVDSRAAGIPGELEVGTGKGGLPLIKVRNAFAECDIYQFGAHVARFVPKGETDLLWMSPTSPFQEGRPIRGGIPVCFPWFGPHGTRGDLPLHGVARLRTWEFLYAARLSDGRTRLALGLSDDEASRSVWPHEFRLELELTVGRSLELTLLTENPGKEPFLYEDCFHSYFAVSHPHRCEIAGLDGTAYIDRLRKDARGVQSGALVLSGETVNAYMRSPSSISIRDEGRRRVRVDQRGFSSVVVWNPGAEAGGKNPEIGASWDQYLCVESANCLDGPVILGPGNAHRSTVKYTAEPLKGGAI